MKTLDDWNARRKARGRIRRARRRRRRQRIAAIALLLMLVFGAFAIGAVRYGATKHKQAEIAATSNISYSTPRIEPLLARAESPKPESELPQLLNIRERFPDYDDGPRPESPDDESSGGEDDASPDNAPASLVILDDLRAAPPKSMFVRAVFENADETSPPKKSRDWLMRDWRRDGDEVFGRKQHHHHKKKMPPIPEPGTGLLLGLGLVTLSGVRNRERRRTKPGATSTRKRSG